MIKNYLIIAFRFMSRQRGFSIINILGLTIGMVCSLLILLYIHDELSYDSFHPDASSIYRVGFSGKLEGRSIVSAQTAAPLASTVVKEIPEAQSVTRIACWTTFPVRHENKAFTEKKLLLADKNFFSFFNFKLAEGNPDSVLIHPRQVVITRSAAARYFDYTGEGPNPIGKEIELAQGYTAHISGIAEDPPLNSHVQYTLILSLISWEELEKSGWLSNKVYTYFKLKPGATIADVDARFTSLLERHATPELQHLRYLNSGESKVLGNDLQLFIKPMLDIHLRSHLPDEIESNGNIQYIYLFGSIAIFITLLACINFMNLSTARSASRAKEVGVRKAVGADTSILVSQFLMESFFYIGVAVIFALFLILILLPPFNYFTEKHLSLATFFDPFFIIIAGSFILCIGLLAGSYPAFYLTRFSPIDVLKGKLRERIRSYGIRNGLVIFQFFISAGLIIATLTVYQQLTYFQKINLGFNKTDVVDLLHTRNLLENGERFKKEVLTGPGVISASYANRLPPNVDWQSVFRTEQSRKNFLLTVYEMDYDHPATMGYTMVSGRFFDRNIPTDSLAVILNETAARQLGLIKFDSATLITNYDTASGKFRHVIGIMKDFNFQPLRHPIQPMAVVLGNEPNWEMAIRINNDNREETLAFIQQLFKKYAPHAAFEHTLVEQNFDARQKTERQIGLLFLLFTFLAILIACLGLFGLATFTAEQRVKEIGVRKVLGASVPEIARMLNKDFLKLVLIANLLAWPVAGWLMSRWLNQFAYHISLSWWIFVISGACTVIIAFLSVSFRAIQAASGNPIKSLRNE